MNLVPSESKKKTILTNTAIGFVISSICFAMLILRMSGAWNDIRSFLFKWYLDSGGVAIDLSTGIPYTGIRIISFIIIFLLAFTALLFLNRGYYYRENTGLGQYWRNYFFRLSGASFATASGLWALGGVVRILSEIPLN